MTSKRRRYIRTCGYRSWVAFSWASRRVEGLVGIDEILRMSNRDGELLVGAGCDLTYHCSESTICALSDA